MEKKLETQLRHKKEKGYLILSIIVSTVFYLMILFSLIGIVICFIIGIISAFIHALSMAHIRRNAVRISDKQFPDLYGKVAALSEKMGLKKMPAIYVMQSNGILNAFATRFFGKNMVVLYSEIFDLIEEGREDEVLFVLAHELAHIKKRHLSMHAFILPAMWIPFLGEAYLRACEYSCDRYAAYYTGNLQAAQDALMTLAIGKKMQYRVDKEVYMAQLEEEKGFFLWLSEKLSTHPHLPKRMNALLHWHSPERTGLIKERKRYGWILMAFTVSLFAAFLYVVFLGLPSLVSNWLDEADSFLSEDIDYTDESFTELMDAASQNDIERMKAELEAGADPNEGDSEDSSPLLYAVWNGHLDAAKLLIESGSDLNKSDQDGSIPLIEAAYNDDTEMVKLLLKLGADPTVKDSEGMTAYEWAKENRNKHMMDLLK